MDKISQLFIEQEEQSPKFSKKARGSKEKEEEKEGFKATLLFEYFTYAAISLRLCIWMEIFAVIGPAHKGT